MREVSLNIKLKLIAFIALWGLFLIPAVAQCQQDREVKIEALTGTVDYQEKGRGDWLPVSKDTVLHQRDRVRTGDDSTCTLLFEGMSDATINLNPNSILNLRTVRDSGTGDDTELDLSLGSVLVMAEELQGDSSFKVRTPNSVVGIRGTVFEVEVN
jgi:hypothetical protein